MTDPDQADRSGVPHARALVAYCDSVVRRETEAIPNARAAVESALGREGAVEAAGVIGVFERMNRIADATGIELDSPTVKMTEDFREDIGINAMPTAAHTPSVSA